MPHKKQQGIVLIIVLWFIILVTILVFTLASETRLSATMVSHHQQAVTQRADLLKALRLAEMELLLSRMPEPPKKENEEELEERKNPYYRFDGRPLTLSYPNQPENIIIRIYDHAGLLNLRRLAPHQMQTLLTRYIGTEDKERLNQLMDAWQDWIDPDDLERLNGAESTYYQDLENPYEPRQGLLETVEELLLIRGFAEIFTLRDLNSAFTIYGNSNGINPNLASREILETIPGLSTESIEKILQARQEKEFNNNQDLNEIMEATELNEFIPWVHFTNSSFYTIALQTIDPNNTTPADPDEAQRAFMVTVQIMGTSRPPQVLRVDPYGILPDSGYAFLPAIDKAEDNIN
jgi:general secretion pathway protein K